MLLKFYVRRLTRLIASPLLDAGMAYSPSFVIPLGVFFLLMPMRVEVV